MLVRRQRRRRDRQCAADSAASISADTSISARQLVASSIGSVRGPAPKFECATLEVPLDYDEPDGETIELALIRLPAGDPSRRIGSLLLNPGGPGASGVEFLPQFALTDGCSTIRDRFDLVSFDPARRRREPPARVPERRGQGRVRGVRRGARARRGRGHRSTSASGFAEACCSRSTATSSPTSAPSTPLVTSIASERPSATRSSPTSASPTAPDSAASTRELFPDKVRAMVLDGAMEPDPAATDFDANQADGFQQAFDAYVADCDADPSCDAGPDAAALIDRLLGAGRERPDPGRRTTTACSPRASLTSGVLNALYAKELWPALSAGPAPGRAGRRQPAARDRGCARRTQARRHLGQPVGGELRRELPRRRRCGRPRAGRVEPRPRSTSVSPDFGPVIAWSRPPVHATGPCPPNPIPVAVAAGAPPIVVIGTTRDPATPFVWAERMADTLATGVLARARRRRTHRVRREPVHPPRGERLPDRREGAGRQDVLRRVAASHAFAVAPAASAG